MASSLPEPFDHGQIKKTYTAISKKVAEGFVASCILHLA
jgi:hypothetical protein